jgi:hypothetical protein
MVDSELLSQAMEAASEVARSVGVKQVEQVLLHHAQHITVLWPSVDTVARIVVSTDDATERLSRELAVARYLTEKGAPVSPPSAVLPAGPHFRDKFGMTLWQFVPHIPADEDNPAHVTAAAAALCHIHRMLADYPGRLPSFRTKIDECRLLLGADRRCLRLLMRIASFCWLRMVASSGQWTVCRLNSFRFTETRVFITC